MKRGQIPMKRGENKISKPKSMEMKKVKIDESYSSANQSTSATSEITKKNDLMDVMSGDFKDIRYMPAFVDKSMLLETIIQKKYKSVCLIAPRRFGKSVNLTMLKHFWEVLPDEEAMSENRNLFKDTKIEENCPEIVNSHCGKYPVILLDFKCSGNKVTSYEGVLELLRCILHKAYESHSYLQNSYKLNKSQKKCVEEWCDDRTYDFLADTPTKIEVALENLVKYLVKHFGQKVIVLVDEYDCVCSNAIIFVYVENIEKNRELPPKRHYFEAEKEIRDIIALCMGVIASILKSNVNVVRAVLTGISYLATMGLSQLTVQTFKFQDMHDFSKFYGFTLKELKEVLSRKDVSMESKYDEIIQHYNGYRGEMLNTWSVIHYLNDMGERQDKNYWIQSGVVANLCEVLKLPTVRARVNKLLSGISNEIEINYLSKIEYSHIKCLKDILDGGKLDISNVSVFFNFLLDQGYLTGNCNISDNNIKVKILNLEIKSEFHEKLLFNFSSDFNLDTELVKECGSLFDKFTTSDKDNEELLKKINDSLNEIFLKFR